MPTACPACRPIDDALARMRGARAASLAASRTTAPADPCPYDVLEVLTVIAAMADEAAALAPDGTPASAAAVADVRTAFATIREAAHRGAQAARHLPLPDVRPNPPRHVDGLPTPQSAAA
jgi:hypothetical protein